MVGDLDQAQRYLDLGRAIRSVTPPHRESFTVHRAQAALYAARGQHHRALLSYEHAVAIDSSTVPMARFEFVFADETLAMVRSLIHIGDYDTAEDRLGALDKQMLSVHGSEHHLLTPVWVERGHLALARKSHAEARSAFCHAWELFDPQQVHPKQLATIHFGLGRSAWALAGSDREARGHARALVESALIEYESWTVGAEKAVEAIHRWLRLHRRV